MPSRVQEPVSIPDPHADGEQISHPAYGLIGCTRVTTGGEGVSLTNSDIRHNRFIEISVHSAHNARRYSEDHFHADNTLVKIALSEAQWATFVSSMNVGDGVPCTISYAFGEYVPELPAAQPVRQFRQEMAADIAESAAAIRRIQKTLAETRGKMPKGVADLLLELAQQAERAVASSAPFVARRFEEHMERTVEQAKSEVHAHAVHTMARLGMVAGPDLPRLEIGSDRE